MVEGDQKSTLGFIAAATAMGLVPNGHPNGHHNGHADGIRSAMGVSLNPADVLLDLCTVAPSELQSLIDVTGGTIYGTRASIWYLFILFMEVLFMLRAPLFGTSSYYLWWYYLWYLFILGDHGGHSGHGDLRWPW